MENYSKKALFDILAITGSIVTITLAFFPSTFTCLIDNYHKNLIDEILYVFDLQKNPPKELEGKYKIVTEEKEYIPLAFLFLEHGLEIDKKDENGKTILQKEIKNKTLIKNP